MLQGDPSAERSTGIVEETKLTKLAIGRHKTACGERGRHNARGEFLIGKHTMIRNAILILAGGLMLWEMTNASPLNDEPAHLASGIILVRLSDPGYFKVNPPLHKLLSGIAVEAVTNLQLPAMIHSSHYSNAVRPEFATGDTVMDTNQSTFLHALFIARLVRIPVILLGTCDRDQVYVCSALFSLPDYHRTVSAAK